MLGGSSFINRVCKHFIFEERVVVNRAGNTAEFLIDNSTRTNVHVPNLGISHLVIGQANIHPGA